MAKVRGINHVTLAVTDLSRSVRFYRDVLGCNLRASWEEGAYLEAGTLWLCLSLDAKAGDGPNADYTHLAFDVTADDFELLSSEIRERCVIWKQDQSEGASQYFLDPDGHKLELHVGSLQSRLTQYLAENDGRVEFYPA